MEFWDRPPNESKSGQQFIVKPRFTEILTLYIICDYRNNLAVMLSSPLKVFKFIQEMIPISIVLRRHCSNNPYAHWFISQAQL